jgi:RND family efflux transporter MFP subunit
VVRTDRVRVFVDLPEMEAPRVQPGNRALVRVRSLGGRVFEGAVTRTAWALDPNARTLHTEVDVANPDKELRPGMYAEVSIELEESKSPCIVPATAVVMQQNQPWCFVVVDGKAVRKSVKVGISSGTETEITSGLDGDELVIAKAASLTDGQVVELTEPSAPK